MGVKEQLVEKKNQKTKLTKSMNIEDMIKTMKPEIEKALPKVITPERFTRMALSAVNTTPKLAERSQMTFNCFDERSTAWIRTKHATWTGLSDSV